MSTCEKAMLSFVCVCIQSSLTKLILLSLTNGPPMRLRGVCPSRWTLCFVLHLLIENFDNGPNKDTRITFEKHGDDHP